MSNEMDFTFDFERQVSNDLVRGIGRWQRRRRAKARVGALAALILVFGGGMFALFGSLGAEPPAEVASDAIEVAPTATAAGDDAADETEPEQSTEPAGTAQSVTADQPGTDAEPADAADGDGTDNSTFTTGERGARSPAADATSSQSEPGSDGESAVADAADSRPGSGDDTDEDSQTSEPDASVTKPPDAVVPGFEISSVTFEGNANAITAIVELTHEPACLRAVFDSQDALRRSYTVDVTERDDCAGKPETTWGALTLGAIEPGIGRFELNGTLWEFIVPAPSDSDDEALPQSEIELTLAASDITIEYAKYRDDYERNQADPGSYLASIATIATLVPDCYTLTAEPGPNNFEVTVTAVLDTDPCDDSGIETLQTVEITLPGSATREVGRKVANVDGFKIPFWMGDGPRPETAFEEVALIRGPIEYSLEWYQGGNSCSEWTLEPDPDRPGEWLSERFSIPLPPSPALPPGVSPGPYPCVPLQRASTSLGLGTSEIPGPITINDRTFTPIILDFDFVGVGSVPNEFVLSGSSGLSYGPLPLDGVIAWLPEMLPADLTFTAPGEGNCEWVGMTTVTASPPTPIAVEVINSCSPPRSEFELTLDAGDITIEYAKYRGDFARNQADPGSYIASIATITTLVPDCYVIRASPSVVPFEVIVTAVLDTNTCNGSGDDSLQTVEIALPGSATRDVGRRVALINDLNVAFFMGDYTTETEFGDAILIRNPTDIAYSPSAIGLDEYALVWRLRGDGCTTSVIEPHPDRAGEWISYSLQPANPPPPPNESYLICAPVQGWIGLGLGTTAIPEPVTINGRTFTPTVLDFDLYRGEGQPTPGGNADAPPLDQFRMLIWDTAYTNFGQLSAADFGRLSADGLIAVLSESLPARIQLRAPTSDPLCSWIGSTTVTASPPTPIVVDVAVACS